MQYKVKWNKIPKSIDKRYLENQQGFTHFRARALYITDAHWFGRTKFEAGILQCHWEGVWKKNDSEMTEHDSVQWILRNLVGGIVMWTLSVRCFGLSPLQMHNSFVCCSEAHGCWTSARGNRVRCTSCFKPGLDKQNIWRIFNTLTQNCIGIGVEDFNRMIQHAVNHATPISYKSLEISRPFLIG